MARKLRPDIEDGWHHVMNRGIDREVVFHSADSARTFLWLVGEAAELLGVEVHAYALMRNHFHLLVHCPEGRLSAFMQRVGARFTQAVNQQLERDGPLFRGRFHSRLVDSPEYRAFVGRYIHRNPLDVHPPVSLDQYRWSSYGAYVGTAPRPEWLQTDALLSMHEGRAAFRTFVEGDLHLESPEAIRFAVIAAVAELDLDELEVSSREQLERLVALALLDGGGVAVEALRTMVGDLSYGAKRTALSRARRRVADAPWLAETVERARRYAA
jgi:REP element-mobilizing transposase RayT